MHMPMPPTYDWREVHGECLVCSDCREYEPSQDEDTRTVEALP